MATATAARRRPQRRSSRRAPTSLEKLSKEDRRLYESIAPEVDYVPHPDYRLALFMRYNYAR
jgi:hypothetical protein